MALAFFNASAQDHEVFVKMPSVKMDVLIYRNLMNH